MLDRQLEHVEKLRIHEMRDYARKLGIPSPTTMNKDELKERITEVLIKRESEKSKVKGDNLKEDNTSVNYLSLLTSPNLDLLEKVIRRTDASYVETDSDEENNEFFNSLIKTEIKEYVYNDIEDSGSFDFCIRQNPARYFEGDDEVSGYLEIHPSGYGIIRIHDYLPDEDDVYITYAMIKKYKLKAGEIVQGKIRRILESKPAVMYQVNSIEGIPTVPVKIHDKMCDIPYDTYDSNGKIKKEVTIVDTKDIYDNSFEVSRNIQTFDEYPYNKLGEEFYLDKFDYKIKRGERQYFSKMEIDDVVKLGYDIVDENSARCKIINLKALPEECFKSQDKLQIINLPFNRTETELANTVELVVERIKREFENNYENVLIIYNFSEMIRSFNFAVEGFYGSSRYDAKAVNKIKNILFSSKYNQKDRSITILCIDKREVPDDLKSLVKSEFFPIFNKIN